MLRTHTCGELRLKNIGSLVVLSGWVYKIRNKGKIIWLDIKDRYGITQLVFQKILLKKKLTNKIKLITKESVLKISGIVLKRIHKNINIATGNIEIEVLDIKILNYSKALPFIIEDKVDKVESLRMKYRYLDLRKKAIFNKLIMRSNIVRIIRDYLNKSSFIEIETPILIKSTPEGSREFLVPSRIYSGQFYSLHQSPQVFKQLLMISGFDKYYQIVKCFRDEDLRSDRQPEFTQIDCEMSFMERKDILFFFENMIKNLFFDLKKIKLNNFLKISYLDVKKKYGTDKPDLRFDMHLVQLNYLVKIKKFKNFDDSGEISCICVKNSFSFSKKIIDQLDFFLKSKDLKLNKLIYIKYLLNGKIKSSINKFFKDSILLNLLSFANANLGDTLLILYGESEDVRNGLSVLRLKLANDLNLINKNTFFPLWVIDFPIAEKDKKTNKYTSLHHFFTSPKASSLSLLNKYPLSVVSNSYDMVINGLEIGGGSIRIHNKILQNKIFKLFFDKITLSREFDFLLNAFSYGCPPHGGIAFGLDRLCALLSKSNSIRNFIAFPKNNSGRDLMINAPSFFLKN